MPRLNMQGDHATMLMIRRTMIAEIQTGCRLLQLGYQSLANLPSEGCYHIDKTSLIREMIRSGRHCFSSCPCCFGKITPAWVSQGNYIPKSAKPSECRQKPGRARSGWSAPDDARCVPPPSAPERFGDLHKPLNGPQVMRS